jgi:ubiquitin-activating enzyme E1
LVITEASSLDELIELNNWCRGFTKSVRFILALSRGVFGAIFCDFGDKFTVYDKDGEEPQSFIISSITQVRITKSVQNH